MLYAATSPEIVDQDLNGKYIVPWARIHAPHPDAENVETGRRLWMWLEEQQRIITGMHF